MGSVVLFRTNRAISMLFIHRHMLLNICDSCLLPSRGVRPSPYLDRRCYVSVIVYHFLLCENGNIFGVENNISFRKNVLSSKEVMLIKISSSQDEIQ